jgi:phosphatidylethanolamine/phosphatidyl-N-methylethanolamine N-methyltransferase
MSNSDLTRMDFLVASRLYDTSARKLYNRLHYDLENIPRKLRFRGKNHNELPEILEIGAGSGEHFDFVKYPFKRYVMTDISNLGIESISKLLQKDKVLFNLADVEDLPFRDGEFNRIVATCVLAHVNNPSQALKELRRVLRVNGTASVFLSADPSILLRLVRFLVVKPKMKNLPLDYALYNALAHKNSCSNLITIAKDVFESDRVEFCYKPFRLPFWNISTHIIMHIRKDN